MKETQTQAASKCFLAPFPGRCVVEREGFKYKGVLAIPDVAKQLPSIGKVVAVGDPMDSERAYLLGKRVVWSRMSGIPIHVANKPAYDIFSYEELLAIVTTNEDLEMEMEDFSLSRM